MPQNELPLRAEDAVAKLKRSRDQTASPDASVKRHKQAGGGGSNSDSTQTFETPRNPENALVLGESSGTLSNDSHDRHTVDSSPVLADVAAFPRRTVGSTVYIPQKLICRGHELDFNCVLQVRVSFAYLSEFHSSEALLNRRIWGTDVYTDDTDLLAALHHLDLLPKGSGEYDHDLLVEILLLPALRKYTGIKRNNLFSRSWRSPHDGISYMVLGKPKEMPRGWAHQGKELMYERFQGLRDLRSWDPRSIVYI